MKVDRLGLVKRRRKGIYLRVGQGTELIWREKQILKENIYGNAY